ncbi:tannase and feruloyl esterase-domain-containing protein, partial [Daldinia loculata]
MTYLLANHSCTASTFSTPTLFGADILSVDANLVNNYSLDVPTGWHILSLPSMYKMLHSAELMTVSVWPAFYMDSTKQYPHACELTKLTSLAISVCDELDGVKDGLIAEPEECRQKFSPSDYIGTVFNCSATGMNMKISPAAVAVANAMWDGPSFSNGDFMWYGYEVGSDLAKIAATNCDENGECIPDGREQLHAIYHGFILRDLSTNITKVTHEEFDYMFRTLQRIFSSSMAATDPNLADFKNAGGKMITYHGLADEAITPASTLKYYKRVMKLDNATSDFFRYYRIPGLAHCWGRRRRL